MDAQAVVGVVAALLALAGAVPYVLDTLAGRTRPNRATWLVYAVIGCCVVASSWSAGGTWSLLTPVAYIIGPIAILIASIRHGEGGWSRLDRACLAGAALGTAAWLLSGDPRVGVWLHTAVDALGTVPTMVKAWRDPAHENRRAWTIYAISAVLNLGAIGAWTAGAAVFPVWLALGCSSVAGILWWRHGRAGAGPSRRMG